MHLLHVFQQTANSGPTSMDEFINIKSPIIDLIISHLEILFYDQRMQILHEGNISLRGSTQVLANFRQR